MEQPFPLDDELVEAQIHLTKMSYENWFYQDLFTFQWWTLLFIFIVPWVTWWQIVDKKRIVEIMLYGVMLAHVITVLDAIGAELGIWSYPYKVLPLFNRLLAVDFSALPVIFMVMYQRFSKWKPFIFAHVLLAVVLAFILEPIAIWLEFTKYHHWKHAYSFPVYVTIPIFMKWFIGKVVAESRPSM